MITLIAAIGLNCELGKDNKLLWNLKDDLQYFKNVTTNHTVVMGFNTYKSFGKPLANRKNIVLTRNHKDDLPDNVTVLDSIAEVLKIEEDIYIIGGSQIYRQMLPFADKILLTIVDAHFPEADTFFPRLPDGWKCVSKVLKEKDERNEYDHWYCQYENVLKEW